MENLEKNLKKRVATLLSGYFHSSMVTFFILNQTSFTTKNFYKKQLFSDVSEPELAVFRRPVQAGRSAEDDAEDRRADRPACREQLAEVQGSEEGEAAAQLVQAGKEAGAKGFTLKKNSFLYKYFITTFC